MSTVADPSSLQKIFVRLKSKTPNERTQAVVELRNNLVTTARESTSEQFTRYSNEINNKIFELIHGSDPAEKIGGILAVDTLIEFFGGEDKPNQTSRLANYLRYLIPSNDIDIMKLAAKTLGKLAIPGGPLTSDFVDHETRSAIELLQVEKQESKRHAAVLIIASIAENSPTLFYAYVNTILENIWSALRDPKLIIRIDAAYALEKCLDVIYERDMNLKKNWFNKLIEGASQGFKMNTSESIHGSLLVFKELVKKGGIFIQDKYDAIFETSFKYREHKYNIIRQEVTHIVPLLAAYNPQKFAERYLHRTLLFYLTQLKEENERAAILVSIGDISYEVEGQVAAYLDAILDNIREGLNSKSKVKKDIEAAIFYCIGKLAIAVGPALTKHLQRDILDILLSCSLSDHMRECLLTLAQRIPPIENTINTKVLNLLSFVLSGYAFSPPGSPNFSNKMNPQLARSFRDQMSSRNGLQNQDDVLIIQALKMLSAFDFKNESLYEFVRFCTITYVEHENPDVRKYAAITSCELFLNDSVCFQTSSYSLNAVSEVLDQLLTVAITDPVPEIRLELLNSLGKNFDPQLSQADNVRLLFMALNDEVFEIQKVAIQIIGRLSSINPAYIIPFLRKTLIQLLTKLEYAVKSRKQEESAVLLSLLIKSSRSVAKPYVKPISDVLLPKSRDKSASVASACVTAIGELAVVAGEDIKPFIKELMPLIIEILQDQSSSFKRDSALKTLGQLAGSSGYVIQPLLDYPQLLNIIINILKLETSPAKRRETVKLLGILGALDPYKHKEVERTSKNIPVEGPPTDIALLMQGMSPSNEEYYPTVVISTLMKILKDQSLSGYHSSCIQTIVLIFKTITVTCLKFTGNIINVIIDVMHGGPPSWLEFYFKQLSALIAIVKQHIRPYLGEVFAVIKEFFAAGNAQVTIISLIESIAKALGGEFKIHLPQVLSLLLEALNNDKAPEVSLKVLNSLVVFGSNSEELIHLIIPNVVRLFENGSTKVRKAAIVTVGKLSKNVNLNDMASRIVHTLLRVLVSNNDELVKASMNTLSLLLLQMGTEFSVFIPIINKTLVRKKILSPVYDQLVNKLLNDEPLPHNLAFEKETDAGDSSEPIEQPSKKLPVNQQVLKNAWQCSQCRTKEDWQEWSRRLSVQLLRESPSHALRACSDLASSYYPLARDLFNASFASCWSELYTQHQEELVQSLCTALSSPNNPPEIYQTLLNLAEFMEHDDKPLPIHISTLGQYAQRCHAYAKALHYKEVEFSQEPSTPTIEALISINNQLQQSDAAIGILKHAQQHHDLQLKETWYEKLQRWEDALKAYNQRTTDSIETTMGKMRCLHALGEWDQLSQLAQEKWTNSPTEIKRAVAPLAAAAAWGLGEWDRMDTYIAVMKPESPDRAFFNAILSLHRNNFDDASEHIVKARDLLVTEITALVSESYSRAYNVVVRVQMLAELEEIISYRNLPSNSEARVVMRKTWNSRLLGCQRNVDIWQRLLKVRSLVVKPKQDMEMWIKFANLCRKSGRLGLAEKSLNSLLEEGDDPNTSKAPPQVVYAQLKYMWATGSRREALSHLIDFTSRMSHDLGLNPDDLITQPLPQHSNIKNVEEYTRLLARCFLKQGEWQVALQTTWRSENSETILGSYLLATHFDSNWYKAWHNWALANFEVISLLTSKSSINETNELEPSYPVELIQQHVIPAIKGFFHSIALSESNPLQDTLRLLTLWFTFGGIPEAAQAMSEGFLMVKIDTWLEVIPQLISRIHQPNQIVSRSLHGLLSDFGKAHPQALVYPLAVAIKSDSISRQRAALSIIDKMRIHSPTLVAQSELVSNELIRVAVLWHELWYEGLEDASRLFFGEHNTEKMFTVLEPLHKMLDRGPETLREISFQNTFGRDLANAFDWVLSFRRSKDISKLNQAWDIYYNVFRRINRQLPQLQTLELQYVSPKLLAAHDLDLAVPGTYEPSKPIVRIMGFDPSFTVISSKQRPRKVGIHGSDGKEYYYALKGHEDIRQDNLVMQLFGLVNTLLMNDPECFKRHLDIQRFAAIPLSPKSGLLGWVPNSDTFHVLIREYRESRNIILNIEHRIMLQMAPDYDNLTLLQKVEVFTYALDNTRGQDLYKVLWLKSRSSESWLDRRTTYTRSLAVMSMTGYILGLGDRHPSNLMLDRLTGKVVHIDFGDCFEAAILREKYPEKVPFRLTRMLTYAMEVSGIEGSFRITCEYVMGVLRDNKESLMAILEAFAYDPLINWGFDLPAQTIADATGTNIQQVNTVELLRHGQIDEQEAARLEVQQKIEIRNARAQLVLKRITDKLTGNDFHRYKELNVPNQVDKLIQQATSVENLCQHYIGWCSFW
jgi:FKBP12-rapamycin complex-associated protein